MQVLIAVNGVSDGCADPIAAVDSFPWPPGVAFSVLTVSEVLPPPAMVEAMAESADTTGLQEGVDQRAGETAIMAAAQLKDHGWQAAGISRRGDPEKVIVEYAKESGADLIVVGSCEKSLLEKVIWGSVSNSVVKHAPCSVLVVKPGAHDLHP